MSINRTTFFAYARRAPFGNRLTQQQIDGMQAIFKAWNGTSARDLRQLAYIFATAFHETGGRMAPVREGFAKNDAAARKIVRKYQYGRPDSQTQQVYYGRGFVQLTWRDNYAKLGQIFGVDLVKFPDRALDVELAAGILVEGMLSGVSGKGDFTGKHLDMYFSASVDDPAGARAIVNGSDKAQLIAGYHASFLEALKAADTATPQPLDVVPEKAQADAPALATDKTLWGGIVSAIGTGGVGFLTSVNNPWAFAAVAIVGVGVILFLTGRLQIRRQGGV